MLLNVADLLRQLFLAQLVQDVELLCQNHVLEEPVAGQLHSHDDLSVGHHHCDCPELDFEILGQLLTTCVAGVLQPNHHRFVP